MYQFEHRFYTLLFMLRHDDVEWFSAIVNPFNWHMITVVLNNKEFGQFL